MSKTVLVGCVNVLLGDKLCYLKEKILEMNKIFGIDTGKKYNVKDVKEAMIRCFISAVAIILVIVSRFFYKGHRDVIDVYKKSFVWVFLAAVFYNIGDLTMFILWQ